MEYHGVDFSLVRLREEDACSLNQMMLANRERFEQFLPVTLAQNTNLYGSEIYISTKSIEWSNGINYTLAIKSVHDNEIAGLIILKNLDVAKRQGEFAYCISEEFGGKGWVTKAVGVFVEMAVEYLQICNFQIIAHVENYPSINVAKNNGFRWVKTLENSHIDVEGQPMDMELFELNVKN
ncbi:GNAT family N-acetyltransferase [Flavobacteriaceae bacterium F08102]|nr:GNAT family N-acetyltransferase [Flavobacteriaceae bacterium F08102]